MREVVVDTETTGLSHEKGHRIVEIGAIELVHRVPTGRHFHAYINPKRPVPEEAFLIHGLSEEFLKDYPTFDEIKDDFMEFAGQDSRLVIHNAEFDLGFINAELRRSNHPCIIDRSRVVDTLALAKKRFPGMANNLDALCKRFGISLTRREKHGALLDAQLLVEVYIELMGGRQGRLDLGTAPSEEKQVVDRAVLLCRRKRPVRLTKEEEEAHSRLLESLSGRALWYTSVGSQV